MNDSFLTQEQISLLRLNSNELVTLRECPGAMTKSFYTDWIDGCLPLLRQRTIDINVRKIVLHLRQATQKGIEPELINLQATFNWKVGEEEWQVSL